MILPPPRTKPPDPLFPYTTLFRSFLQFRPIVTAKKLTPKLDKRNPVEGIKKMFSRDNLVELIKSIVKSAALIFIGAYVLWCMLPQLLLLPSSPPAAIGSAVWHALLRIEIGRAPCRERVCQYVSISVGAVSFKQKTTH